MFMPVQLVRSYEPLWLQTKQTKSVESNQAEAAEPEVSQVSLPLLIAEKAQYAVLTFFGVNFSPGNMCADKIKM